jgi:hypothetical protein
MNTVNLRLSAVRGKSEIELCEMILANVGIKTKHNPDVVISQWKSNMKRDGTTPLEACTDLVMCLQGL